MEATACKVRLLREARQLATCGQVVSDLIDHKHEGEAERQSQPDEEASWKASLCGGPISFSGIQSGWHIRGG